MRLIKIFTKLYASQNNDQTLSTMYGRDDQGEVSFNRTIEEPAFIFSSIRSGSTLLSSILDAHTDIYAPSETHFSRWSTEITLSKPVTRAIKEFGLSGQKTRYLLWDGILRSILDDSKKHLLVEKTPRNVIKWEEITTCWPKAKIIFLLRHPVSIAQSWQDAKPKLSTKEVYEQVLRYMNAIEEARHSIKDNYIVVKYEDIVNEPDRSIEKLCTFLGVEFEPDMLNYGAKIDANKKYKRGIGDWSDKIKSGKIQKGRKLPEESEIPKELVGICRAWGYMK